MKSILVFCFLLTIGAGYHQGQQSGKEKAVEIKPESTLKETTDWLKEKLESAAGYHQDDGYKSNTCKIQDVYFQNCSLTFRETRITKLNMRTFMDASVRSALVLSNIDPSKITVAVISGVPTVKIPTVEGKKTIKNDLDIALPSRREKTISTTSELELPFEDQDTAERVAKAFAHAVNLCKGKKEPS
ncbi:MAG TPA: hypothetical protein VFQ92_20520 [Blastocatellia bacterium]|nr:hypothetical protein [Blastocatellia bacterium]